RALGLRVQLRQPDDQRLHTRQRTRRASRHQAISRDARRATRRPGGGRIVGMNPELEAFLPLFPPADLDDPVVAREKLAGLSASAPPPDTSGLTVEDHTADGDVAVRLYRPRQAHGAIIWLHGGGFVMGDLDTEHPWATRVANGSGAVVISVGYRRAPEHPYPAALDDAYAVLVWTAEHAADLGIDPGRIATGGQAAGAGLAAALALRTRDEHGPTIRYQLLNQP